MDYRNMKRKGVGEGEGEASSSKKGRGAPRKYKDGEERRLNKITSCNLYRLKTTATEKRLKKFTDCIFIWMACLNHFLQTIFKIGNPKELKTELEKLRSEDVKIQDKCVTLQNINEELKTEIEELHGAKKRSIDSFIEKYGIINTTDHHIKVTSDEELKKKSEIRSLNKVLKESAFQKQEGNNKELISLFVAQHLSNVDHDLKDEFKRLPVIWERKWMFRWLEDENEALTTEREELSKEISELEELIKDKLTNSKLQEVTAEFKRNLKRERRRIENVKDDFEAEIERLTSQNELLASIQKYVKLPPTTQPGSSEDLDFAEWMNNFQFPENNCPPDNLNVPDEFPENNCPPDNLNVHDKEVVEELQNDESRSIPPAASCSTTIIALPMENGVCYACKCVKDFLVDQLKDKKNGYKLSDFRNYDGQGWMMNHENIFPPHLEYVHKGIGRDVTRNTTLGDFIVNHSRALFYAVIDEMHSMKLLDIDEHVIEKWGVIIKEALRLDLDVEFAEVHLKKIAHAYFSKKELEPLQCLISTSEQELEEMRKLYSEKWRELDEMKVRYKDKSEEQRNARHIICTPEETETFDNDGRLSAGIL